jgi:ribonuclease HI
MTKKQPEVIIYTDGACKNNPGIGGWGAVISFGRHRKELSGSEEKTTNNRMEMMAAIKGLQALKKPCSITLNTDSKYLCDAFRQNWFSKWKKNGWKTSKGTKVLNQDLWGELLEQNAKHTIKWKWVKGHSDNEENNCCDRLAVEARLLLEEQLKKSTP